MLDITQFRYFSWKPPVAVHGTEAPAAETPPSLLCPRDGVIGITRRASARGESPRRTGRPQSMAYNDRQSTKPPMPATRARGAGENTAAWKRVGCQAVVDSLASSFAGRLPKDEIREKGTEQIAAMEDDVLLVEQAA
jgi:hypothetical protein